MQQVDTDVVVVGAGQAGLAAGYHLLASGKTFVILDAEDQVGNQWRRRWDSLRLFTPVRHAALPGAKWEQPRGYLPSKDETANYLASYASNFELPVRARTVVSRITQTDQGFVVDAVDQTYRCTAVLVCTGATSTPYVPRPAASIDPAITQLHSQSYRNAKEISGTRILVVGYGTSGAEIALELARAGKVVTIAGSHTPAIPRLLLAVAGDVWWRVLTRVLNRATRIGRRVAVRATTQGAPLIGISPRELRRAGVTEAGRVEDTRSGRPIVNGETLDVDTIIWCTGYRGDFSWLELPALRTDERGFPIAPLGLAKGIPGLGFVGMPFQSRLASTLLGGVGEDAGTVVAAILSRANGAILTEA